MKCPKCECEKLMGLVKGKDYWIDMRLDKVTEVEKVICFDCGSSLKEEEE